MIQDIENEASIDSIYQLRGIVSKSVLKIQPSGQSNSTIDMSILLPQESPSKQCRICLDSTQFVNNEFIAPCKCTGSVKYVHDNCYRKWFERKYQSQPKKQQQQMLNRGIQCQICKDIIKVDFQTKYHCYSWQQFKQKVKKDITIFGILLVFLILNLGCFSYLIAYSISNEKSIFNSYLTWIMVVGCLLFLAITLITILYYFIVDYVIQLIMVLKSFQIKKSQRKKPSNRYQVYPASVEEIAQ